MGNFQPLEVVDRGSETQSQEVGNLIEMTSGYVRLVTSIVTVSGPVK